MDPNAAQWLAAVAATGTLLTAIAATFIGLAQVKQARAARQQSAILERESQQQALDLERHRSQPAVAVFMEGSAAGQEVIEIVVRNYGQTPAIDVEIFFDPTPQRVSDIDDSHNVGVPSPISYLAPGQELRVMWDVSFEYLNSDLPMRVSVNVSYTGIAGEELRSSAVLDWGIFESFHYARVYSLHDAAKALTNLDNRTKEWTESNAGLRVVTRSGAERDAAKRQHYQEWLKARGQLPAPRDQPPPKRRAR